jgi:hypothetical protein
MNHRAKCDACGDRVTVFVEMSFDAEFFEFFATFDGFTKKIERGRIRFRFCVFCIFGQLQTHGDTPINLVKQTLGLSPTGIYREQFPN